MLDDKTSKLPWKSAHGSDEYHGNHVELFDADFKPVAIVRGHEETYEADADLIVRAVNAHEALTDLCELFYLKLLRSQPETRMRIQRELCALRDTIALARGAEPEDVQNEFEARARQ